MRVGVFGASGYAGAEVLRLCAAHPDLDVVVATGESHAGERVGEHVAALAGAWKPTSTSPSSPCLTARVNATCPDSSPAASR
jgi:N-acetyl-gamma-glutamyl-phosphate reductase